MDETLTPQDEATRGDSGDTLGGQNSLDFRSILEPYGWAYYNFIRPINIMATPELKELLMACRSCTTTNCWSETYRAAQLLEPEISQELNARESTKPKAGGKPK